MHTRIYWTRVRVRSVTVRQFLLCMRVRQYIMECMRRAKGSILARITTSFSNTDEGKYASVQVRSTHAHSSSFIVISIYSRIDPFCISYLECLPPVRVKHHRQQLFYGHCFPGEISLSHLTLRAHRDHLPHLKLFERDHERSSHWREGQRRPVHRDSRI